MIYIAGRENSGKNLVAAARNSQPSSPGEITPAFSCFRTQDVLRQVIMPRYEWGCQVSFLAANLWECFARVFFRNAA